jgi:outer membrane receptor protein involved in Fe transport
MEIKSGNWIFRHSLDYAWSRSTVIGALKDQPAPGHQLPYVPVHSGSLNSTAWWKSFQYGMNFPFTGKRNTSGTAVNGTLPACFLANTWLGYTPHWKHFTADMRFSVLNLFNSTYQLMASYPMPGRYFMISGQVTFGK